MLKSFSNSVLLLLAVTLLWPARALAQQQPDRIADTTLQARIGVLPLPILFYTPETGIAGGGAILMLHRPEPNNRKLRPSSYVLDLIYTEKKQIVAEVSADIYLAQGMYRIVGMAHYSKYPLKFFGIGSETPGRSEEPYTSRTVRISLDALRKIAGSVSVGPSFVYDNHTFSEFTPEGMLKAGTITGSHGGRTVGLGGVFQWDTRDNVFKPSSGRYYTASLRTTMPGSDFHFSHFSVDLRHYLRIMETTTLAVQGLAMLTAGSPPFYMLAQLGGPNVMRGYYEGRYRDKKLLAVQTEYQFPIFWRFEGAAFGGVGDVAPSLGRFTMNTVKSSYGFGLRYLFDPVEKMFIRIDFGFGKGSSGMYITANGAI